MSIQTEPVAGKPSEVDRPKTVKVMLSPSCAGADGEMGTPALSAAVLSRAARITGGGTSSCSSTGGTTAAGGFPGASSWTGCGPGVRSPGTGAVTTPFLSAWKDTGSPPIDNVQPSSFAGRPVVRINAVPPAGTPARPVAAFKTGTRRLTCLGSAATTLSAPGRVTISRPVDTVKLAAPTCARESTVTFSHSNWGFTTQPRRTAMSLD